MKKHVKIAITGAAGRISYALLFRIASGEMFGPETTIDLHLLELETRMSELNGIVMELEDCAFGPLRKVIVTTDTNECMADVNWVFLIGAIPRKAGMERSDLLKANGKIFKQHGKAISDNAAIDVNVFVVGNPCNANCLIAMNNAPKISGDQFFAMTMLDENRARATLAKKANVYVSKVSNMIVWGNHSPTQYPDFYHTKIEGKPVVDIIKDEKWLQNDFIKSVQMRGAEIIKTMGSSSVASAANAVVSSVRCLINDTSETFSICKRSNGEYGVDEGLIFSYPCRVKNGELEIIEGIEHNSFGKEKLRITIDELRAECDMIKGMGLI